MLDLSLIRLTNYFSFHRVHCAMYCLSQTMKQQQQQDMCVYILFICLFLLLPLHRIYKINVQRPPHPTDRIAFKLLAGIGIELRRPTTTTPTVTPDIQFEFVECVFYTWLSRESWTNWTIHGTFRMSQRDFSEVSQIHSGTNNSFNYLFIRLFAWISFNPRDAIDLGQPSINSLRTKRLIILGSATNLNQTGVLFRFMEILMIHQLRSFVIKIWFDSLQNRRTYNWLVTASNEIQYSCLTTNSYMHLNVVPYNYWCGSGNWQTEEARKK